MFETDIEKLAVASESKIIIHPDFDGDLDFLNDEENTVLSNLTLKEELTINDVISILNKTSVFSIINELIRKEIIQIKEELHDKFKKKTQLIIEYCGGELEDSYQKVKSAKKQKELLKSGDTFRFATNQEHTLINRSKSTTRILMVNYIDPINGSFN